MATRRVSFIISAKNKGFIKALDQSARRMDRFGRKMQRMGRTLSRTVTLPALAAGGAAVKMASDFQSSMTRIETLVGLSRNQVQGMREDVLALAGETGRAPIELSEALFAVTSAGLRGKEAMDTLEMSAKAAAIGLGETRDIARALTGILQSYSEQGLTAAEATDTLIGVVREGNLEASELAPVLGRVTGIASQLGISFDQVGASIASFTRLGVNAEEAVTGLRGILNALLKQTPKAERALGEVGLTFDELRRKIKDEGLAQTLVELVDSFEGNEKALSSFAGRVRGLAAIMGTAGAQSESYLEIANNIADSSGNMDEGFERVSDTVEQRFNEALANLQTQAIKMGEVLLPIVEDIIEKVEEWVDWFGSLDEAGRKAVLRNTAIAAAAGPVLTIFGSLVRTTDTLTRGLTSLVGVIRNVTGATLAMSTAMKAVPWVAFGTLAVATANKARKIWQETRRIGEEVDKLFAKDVENESWRHLEERAERIRQKMVDINRLTRESASGFGGAGLTEDFKKLADELDRVKRKLNEIKPVGVLDTPEAMLGRQGLFDIGVGGFGPENLVFEGAKKTEEALDDLQSTADSMDLKRPFVEVSVPVDKLIRDLHSIDTSINDLTVDEIVESFKGENIPDKIAPPGSLSDLQNRLGSLREKFSMAIPGTERFERLREQLNLTREQINRVTEATKQTQFSWEQFGEVMGRVLSQAILHGKELGQVLKNIGAQLASRALMKGLGLLLSGGTFELGSFIGSIFGVNDALITSEGDVVQFHPDDNILAMKDFGNLGGGGTGVANVNVFMDSWLVDRQQSLLERKRNR